MLNEWGQPMDTTGHERAASNDGTIVRERASLLDEHEADRASDITVRTRTSTSEWVSGTNTIDLDRASAGDEHKQNRASELARRTRCDMSERGPETNTNEVERAADANEHGCS